MTPRAAGRLTRRQRECLRLAAEGLSEAEIGAELGCAANTVRNHMVAVYHKLGVNNRADAWRKMGWLKPTKR